MAKRYPRAQAQPVEHRRSDIVNTFAGGLARFVIEQERIDPQAAHFTTSLDLSPESRLSGDEGTASKRGDESFTKGDEDG